MDPLDFLAFARRVLRHNDEASIRSAVSRAYYAIFLLARMEVTRRDPLAAAPRGPAVHGWVRSHLVVLDGGLGMRVAQLREMRNPADYDITVPITRRDAEEAIALAEPIREVLRPRRAGR